MYPFSAFRSPVKCCQFAFCVSEVCSVASPHHICMCVPCVSRSQQKLVTVSVLISVFVFSYVCVCVCSAYTETLQPETFCWLTAGWQRSVTSGWHETSQLMPAMCSEAMWGSLSLPSYLYSFLYSFLPSFSLSFSLLSSSHSLKL